MPTHLLTDDAYFTEDIDINIYNIGDRINPIDENRETVMRILVKFKNGEGAEFELFNPLDNWMPSKANNGNIPVKIIIPSGILGKNPTPIVEITFMDRLRQDSVTTKMV